MPRLGGLHWVLGMGMRGGRPLSPDCLWKAALMGLAGCAVFNQNILFSGFVMKNKLQRDCLLFTALPDSVPQLPAMPSPPGDQVRMAVHPPLGGGSFQKGEAAGDLVSV